MMMTANATQQTYSTVAQQVRRGPKVERVLRRRALITQRYVSKRPAACFTPFVLSSGRILNCASNADSVIVLDGSATVWTNDGNAFIAPPGMIVRLADAQFITSVSPCAVMALPENHTSLLAEHPYSFRLQIAKRISK